jgi:hypothetical protein
MFYNPSKPIHIYEFYHLSQDADKRNILPAFVLIVGINGNLMLPNSFAIRNTRIEAYNDIVSDMLFNGYFTTWEQTNRLLLPVPGW